MTNENNNINELVAEDDPTVELEAPPFVQDQSGALESDAQTFDRAQAAEEEPATGITVSELQSDLRSRKKTISHLQYDIQQLHTKWLGLETEISAREAQTEQLNNELSVSRETVVRKEKLLKKRDQKIKALKTEIRQREENYRQLVVRVEEMQLSATKASRLVTDSGRPVGEPQQNDLQQRLSRTEEYADSLRQQSQDLIESNARAEREIENLSQRLDDALQNNSRLSDGLRLSEASHEKLQTTLNEIQRLHDDEIRLLRFDLGAAENTVIESEELNNQLASELVDARRSKNELERTFGDVEEQSSERIEKLQKEVSKLHRDADSYEQRAPTDRMTRVLIGTVDDQLLRFPLFKDRLTIGRTENNDIRIKAEYVSRRHAVIQTDGETTRIIDWGSKNGVHVNSVKISEHFLCHGDTVTIGNARFRYAERKKRD